MGSPCDFVSIHAYNRSELMAAKLIRAKEIALEVDAQYYADLWINSYESCPEWSIPPDPAAEGSYLGNGYFPTWCADVTRRLLAAGARDGRYAMGETILTFWQWPNMNFEGANASTRVIHVGDDGDGRQDRTVTVAMPILHFLCRMAAMGERYWPLEERIVGGHIVSGFASRDQHTLTVLLYSHHPLDTESRSGQSFDVGLAVAGFSEGPVAVTEYRFDTRHNSYFRLGRRLKEETRRKNTPSAADKEALADAVALLESDDRMQRIDGLRRLAALGPRAKSVSSLLNPLTRDESDEQLKREAIGTLLRLHAPDVYPASTAREIQELSELKANRYTLEGPAAMRLSARLDANAACVLIVEEVKEPR
jgi:hypothetical protein